MCLAIHKGRSNSTSVDQETLMAVQYQAYNDAQTDPYECPGCGRKEETAAETETSTPLGLFCAACRRPL